MTELQDWGDMGEEMEVLGGDGTVPVVPSLLQPTHAVSLILFLLFFLTWWARIIYYGYINAGGNLGESHTYALMSCAPACGGGDYHLQRH